MSIAMRVVVVDVCESCGGKAGNVLGDVWHPCPECNGNGAMERQVKLEELAGLLLPHIAQCIVGEGRQMLWSVKDPAAMFEDEEVDQ